jgi:hypothetical protein
MRLFLRHATLCVSSNQALDDRWGVLVNFVYLFHFELNWGDKNREFT